MARHLEIRRSMDEWLDAKLRELTPNQREIV
jgi:hypothetical protein